MCTLCTVVENAFLAMSSACYNCHEARTVAINKGAIIVASRLVFDQWSDKSLFKAAITLCANLANDRNKVTAIYELGVVDALVYYILREFGGKRTEESRWWFSALKSLIVDHQLSQDAVEDGGGRMMMNDALNVESPVEPDVAPKIASKSVFAAVLCGGIHGEVLERKLADDDYNSKRSERLEKVQRCNTFSNPVSFRESLLSFRVVGPLHLYTHPSLHKILQTLSAGAHFERRIITSSQSLSIIKSHFSSFTVPANHNALALP